MMGPKQEQMNYKVDEDIKARVVAEAKKLDGRKPGWYLNNLLRTHYKKIDKAAPKKAAKPKQDLGEEIGHLQLASGEDHPIHQLEVDEWSILYPAVNVQQELNKMYGWLKASPDKRKTKSGINKFINGWLSRSQDKGGSNDRFKENGGNGKAEVERRLANPGYNLEQWEQ